MSHFHTVLAYKIKQTMSRQIGRQKVKINLMIKQIKLGKGSSGPLKCVLLHSLK